MIVHQTPIEGLKVIEPKIFKDQRGYFFEAYNKKKFAEVGIPTEFVQDNESKSSKGVLRGLHYQTGKYAQAKLVRVTKGKVWDVAVDLRKNSPSFQQWFGIELSNENKKQLFIPKGLAHGFLVLSDIAVFNYKCDQFYHYESEEGIIYNDKDLDITWPTIDSPYIISEKDKKLNSFTQATLI